MQLDIFTLFPEWFDWFRRQRHIRNALGLGSELRLFNYRDSTPLSHGRVDDTPYGGGPGMVLRVDAVDAALRAAYGEDFEVAGSDRRVVLLTPVGRQLDDRVVDELLLDERVALLCGRYEGFDERVRQYLCNDAISIGPYVLSGGEPAAMVLTDALFRKLPGALGDAGSVQEESFSAALGGAPEYPHYTRPASYRGWAVPEVLRSGDHACIAQWRLEQSKSRADHGDALVGE